MEAISQRRVGLGLLVVGLGWLALSSAVLAVEGALESIGSSVPFLSYYPRVTVHLLDPMAADVVSLFVGFVVLSRTRGQWAGRISFRTAVGTWAVAVVLVTAIVAVVPRYWSPVTVSSVTAVFSPQVFVAYCVAGLFATAVASTRRQRYLGVAGIAALPLASLAILVLLIAADAGWSVLFGLYLFPLGLASVVVSLGYALPLLVAAQLLE